MHSYEDRKDVFEIREDKLQGEKQKGLLEVEKKEGGDDRDGKQEAMNMSLPL